MARRGRRVRRLNVSHAFHSAAMEPMLAEFGEVAAGITYERPRIAVVSNLTGDLIREFSAEYWVRHVRETVRFGDGLDLLTARGVSIFVEVGPDGVLSGRAATAGTCRRRAEDATRWRPCWRRWPAHVAGADVDWSRALPAGPPVALPTYPSNASATGCPPLPRPVPVTRWSPPSPTSPTTAACCSPATCRRGTNPGSATTSSRARSSCPAPP
ncbi:acyltransferase domain-containing protein [Micromonospora sp. M12]